MKAKDLTQADVGKWVTLKVKITEADDGSFPVSVDFDENLNLWLTADTTVEFTGPPAPVQEVGDVFRTDYSSQEWTLASIVNDVCLLTGPVENGQTNGFQSARYPLDRARWTLVRKGAAS